MGFLARIYRRIFFPRHVPDSVTELYRHVHKILPKKPLILEAGAHMGYDTLGLSRLWKSGRIFAVEPVPAIYKELVERTRNQKNVTTFNTALGDYDGTTTMFVSGGKSNASSSVLPPSIHLTKFPDVTFDEIIEVPVKTLGSWMKEQKLDRIDMLWLDMQGFETQMLRAAEEQLKNISVIYTELCKDELYDGMTTRDHYISFLQSHGFELIHLTDQGDVADGIFINKKFKKVPFNK